MSRLGAVWQRLQYSLWFLPGVIVASAIALAQILVRADDLVPLHVFARWPQLFAADAEGARAVLSVLATSAITVAGVTFSVTVVVLALAASQYTSRVLRTFMRSRATQLVLGFFVGMYGYAVVLLRAVSKESVPALAVVGGLVLAVAGAVVLVAFIHHMADSIQVASILCRIAQDTRQAIDAEFPDRAPASNEPLPGADAPAQRWRPIPSHRTGYVQRIDVAGLVKLARRNGEVIRIERDVGEFVAEGAPLAWVRHSPPSEVPDRAVRRAFATGSFKTVDQDPRFGVDEIVDIAVRALSPGINDPTTASMCLDYLGALLGVLGCRRIRTRRDVPGALIAREAPGFDAFVEAAYAPILRYAGPHEPLYDRALASLESAAVGCAPIHAPSLASMAARVASRARTSLSLEEHRVAIAQRARRLRLALERRAASKGAETGARAMSSEERSETGRDRPV